MKRLSILLAALLPAPSLAADIPALAKVFGAREAAWSVRMSPSGDRILYFTPVGTQGTAVVVAEIATGKTSILLSSEKATIVPFNCGWKTEARILCSVYFITNAGSERLTFRRTMSLAADGSSRIELGQRSSDRTIGIDQQGARVIDWLPDDPDNVLMQVYMAEQTNIGSNIAGKGSGNSVQKVDVATGRMTNVERADPGVLSFDSDDRGQVRYKSEGERSNTGYMRDRITYYLRSRDSREWHQVASDSLSGPSKFSYLGFDERGDNIFVARENDGRTALFRQPVDGQGASALLFAHPFVDVDDVLRIGKNRRAVAAVYTVDSTEYAFFDPVLERRGKALSGALPGRPPVTIFDESWDGKRNLVFAGGIDEPGSYYRFDLTSKKLESLLPVRPQVAGMPAGKQTSIRYRAADGVEIPAYLTLPPGAASAKGLPAIVMPHGGPASRDALGYDWLAQFFAQLGYAVLQPNFRGSTGYGEAWYAKNGFKSWAIAIGDVNAGAHWLVGQGANPAGLAIFGWSYGGYAALQANVVEPGLYKAVVAVAPVTDLALLKQNAIGFSNFTVVANEIGEGPHVVAGSPSRNADRIVAPVLIFQGDKDVNVDISQARAMDAALGRANKRHELVIYPGLAHSLDDSAARADMLTRSADWLAAATGK